MMNKGLMLKLFGSLLAIFLLTACGQDAEQQDETNPEEQQEETTEETTEEEAEESTEQ
ncbi:outer membrane biogenesis lipoprotein LolB [Bacillus fengqiuensis]|nr:outer membrane biogenesis lipoprotein LolB [Bacillus fengqiuensis]